MGAELSVADDKSLDEVCGRVLALPLNVKSLDEDGRTP
jgi:hypothetical protein